MAFSWRRGALLGLLVLGLPAARCVLGTDVVGDAFNDGAIDTSGGDPFRDPKNVVRDIVATRIHAELIDAYFYMGPGRAGADKDVSAWMGRVAHDIDGFYELVVKVACEENARVGEPCPESAVPPTEEPPALPPQAQQANDQQAQQARQDVIDEALIWASPPAKEPLCTGPATRESERLMHFVDYMRFTVAVERAVYEAAEIMIEGLANKQAVLDGARLAFEQAADYLKARHWRRELDRRTTGVVVKGGAATGTFSAGIVWVALNILHRYEKLTQCGERCPRFDLISGTSTGAFVAVAIDRFHSATSDGEREAIVQKLGEWFTCFALNDMYCDPGGSLTQLASPANPLQGVLRFDGLRTILQHEIRISELANDAELVLNTVDFRSGRLYALSDQDRREMRRPCDVVDGVLSSAVLPLIAEPVRSLPVDPTEGERAVYLDGGIRSELPVMPLVRRGAERVLIASSAASVLGETSRMQTALGIAARYIDISTGGITDSELAHAKRRVESVRLAESIQCRDLLRGDFQAMCAPNGHCNIDAVCSGRYDASEACAPDKETSNGSSTLAPRLQIRRLWNLVGIFRDESTVDAVHGYDFNEKDQRRLFLAGAEAARRRCVELAQLLGIDTSDKELRRKLVRWCSPALPPDTCSCYRTARGDDEADSCDEDCQEECSEDCRECKEELKQEAPGVRECDEEGAVGRILAACSPQSSSLMCEEKR